MVKVFGPPHVLHVSEVSNGMFPVRFFHSKKSSFVGQLNFMEIITLSQSEVNLATITFGISPDSKQWCPSGIL